MSNIADRLKEIVGENVAQFARELGIHRQTLDNYLKGRIPKADFLDKLAKAKNININWLLTGEGEPYLKTRSEETSKIQPEKEPEKRRQKEEDLSKPKEKMKLTSQKKYLKIRKELLCTIIIFMIVLFIIISHFYIKEKLSIIPILRKNKNSIAILPFIDLSPQKNQEYLCGGIAEAITAMLARIQELKVISRASAMQYKGANKTIKEIGKELGVEIILIGSIQKEKDNIRVSIHLIDTRTGFQIWSDTYERKLKGIFAIQDEIAKAVASELKIKLGY